VIPSKVKENNPYRLDETLLRSKLTQGSAPNVEDAWTRFESYLSKQQAIHTRVKNHRRYNGINPAILLRGFIATLIIVPTLLFYNTVNSKLSGAEKKPLVYKERPKMSGSTNKPVIVNDIGQAGANLELPSPLVLTESTPPLGAKETPKAKKALLKPRLQSQISTQAKDSMYHTVNNPPVQETNSGLTEEKEGISKNF